MNLTRLTTAFLTMLVISLTTMADVKMKTRTRVAGNTMEGTVFIKGARQRNSQNIGGAMTIDTITQCDLKRTVQINDQTRTYMIVPFAQETATVAERPQPDSRQPATRRGGVVTYTSVITDTGERKDFFGFTARHLKTSMTVDSSPDACNPTKMRMETDGWFIDFEYNFNCSSARPYVPPMAARSRPECQDEVRFKTSGSAKLGYPVLLTTTIYGEDGRTTTTTQEVIELSTVTLDASLFDAPAGYKQASSYQELMGAPSMPSMTRPGRSETSPPVEGGMNAGRTKPAGGIRVGVVAINNKTDRNFSTDAARAALIAGISGGSVDAVPLDATSPAAVEAEAKQKECDYILYTDVAEMKKSGSKVGGLLGRAAGVNVAGEKYEARLDFRLFATRNTSPEMTSSSSAKEEGGETFSLAAAASREAKAVVSQVLKRK